METRYSESTRQSMYVK